MITMCPRPECNELPMRPGLGVLLGCGWWCAMTSTGQIIRWSTAGAVVGVAAVAAVASYEHAYALVRAHGETGWIGRLVMIAPPSVTER